MSSFRRKNLTAVKAIFQEKTGVELPQRRPALHPVRAALALAAVLACCTITAFAFGMFSPLDGDELSLSAVYEGDGIVAIQVENNSGKELQFQPVLKLMRWTTGEEVAPRSGSVGFTGTRFPPHSGGTMTIDLSQAYSMEELEQPLTNDWYYLVLTNHNFVFGQDWMCSVDFAEPVTAPIHSPALGETDAAAVQRMPEDLRSYFETIVWDTAQRQAMNEAYAQAYTQLFAQLDGQVVPSVSPVLPGDRIDSASPYLKVSDPASGVVFDESIPAGEQYLLTDMHWTSCDENFKLLAAQGEYALQISALLPSQRYGDDILTVPLLYILTYDRSSIRSETDYAFIYGQLLTFAELEPYRVYEDEQYVCYEISGLMYSDLAQHLEECARQNGDILLNEKTQARAENIYTYYKKELGDLIFFS